jgi:hypothetical protein
MKKKYFNLIISINNKNLKNNLLKNNIKYYLIIIIFLNNNINSKPEIIKKLKIKKYIGNHKLNFYSIIF